MPSTTPWRFGEAYAVPHNLSNGPADDLTIFCYERGDGAALRFDLDANPALYDSEELAEHCRRLTHLADAVLADPECALGQVDILGDSERRRLLHTWNNTAAPLPEPATLLHGMLQRAELMPAAVVAQYDNRTLDYATLCELASRIAAQWVADGVGPGDVVAVALPRSEQLLVALLAVMWSGAAYLPLDPESPGRAQSPDAQRFRCYWLGLRTGAVRALSARRHGLAGSASCRVA